LRAAYSHGSGERRLERHREGERPLDSYQFVFLAILWYTNLVRQAFPGRITADGERTDGAREEATVPIA